MWLIRIASSLKRLRSLNNRTCMTTFRQGCYMHPAGMCWLLIGRRHVAVIAKVGILQSTSFSDIIELLGLGLCPPWDIRHIGRIFWTVEEFRASCMALASRDCLFNQIFHRVSVLYSYQRLFPPPFVCCRLSSYVSSIIIVHHSASHKTVFLCGLIRPMALHVHVDAPADNHCHRIC